MGIICITRARATKRPVAKLRQLRTRGSYHTLSPSVVTACASDRDHPSQFGPTPWGCAITACTAGGCDQGCGTFMENAGVRVEP